MDIDKIILPRGYIMDLLYLLRKYGQTWKICNQVVTLDAVDFGSKIVPRDYQKQAITDLVKGVQGGLIGGCGSGKTEILLEVMAEIGQPSLWITHTNELLDQVIDRACKCFDIERHEIGVIAGGKVSIGDRLTVALVQSLSRKDINEFTNKFGAIFIDEGHHIAANTIYRIVEQFPARFRYWCSATPQRGDGLTELIYLAGGDIIHFIDDNILPVITPHLMIVKTGYKGYLNSNDYTGMMSTLINSKDRNQLIADVIRQEAPGHFSLVLSDRKVHLQILKDILAECLPGMRIEVLKSSMSMKERNAVMDRAKAGQIDILLATKLAREGLDLPHLDRLFLVTPKKTESAIEQEVGRIRRPCNNKLDAVVYDFLDEQNGIFMSQFWKRKAVYESMSMIVDLKNNIWLSDQDKAS